MKFGTRMPQASSKSTFGAFTEPPLPLYRRLTAYQKKRAGINLLACFLLLRSPRGITFLERKVIKRTLLIRRVDSSLHHQIDPQFRIPNSAFRIRFYLLFLLLSPPGLPPLGLLGASSPSSSGVRPSISMSASLLERLILP